MSRLIPFSSKMHLQGFDDFYNMLDNFFSDSILVSRNSMRDTFKIDVKETNEGYLIEAELPGINKEEIDLKLNEDYLTIYVKKEENINEDKDDYIHRERRVASMSRSIKLSNASPDGIKAKLENGVLVINVAKQEKIDTSYKIDIE